MGPDCRPAQTADNIHFHLRGVRQDVIVNGVTITDPIGGHWVWPCNSFNWWLAPVNQVGDELDLFAKPHRHASAGTEYQVIVTYADGTRARGSVIGTDVVPWSVVSKR